MASSPYKPLGSKRSVRLLSIDNAVSDPTETPIICHLVEADIAKAQNMGAGQKGYVALSYTWGDPIWRSEGPDSDEGKTYLDAEHEIVCNGVPFLVRKNLYVVLFRLRCLSGAERFWIDALCIDQDNVAERNAQVAMMGEIYDKAGSVLIWLGPLDHDSSAAMPLIEALGQSLDDWIDSPDCPVQPFLTGLSIDGPKPVFNSTDTFNFFRIRPFTVSEWGSIGRFLWRGWFTRVWTLQEDCLTSASAFWCGPIDCKYALLRNFCRLIIALGWAKDMFRLAGTPAGASGLSGVPEASIMRFKSPENFQWFGKEVERFYGKCEGSAWAAAAAGFVVEESRGRSSSDLKDKIFAPLALIAVIEQKVLGAGSARSTPLPDYARGLSAIFIDFTVYVTKATKNLSLLSQAERCPSGRTPSLELPSWVPDYSTGTIRPAVSLNRRYLYERDKMVAELDFWNACPREPLAPIVEFRTNDLPQLQLRGYHLTNITDARVADSNHPAFNYIDLLKQAYHTFQHRPDIDWLQQLAKTMVCVDADENPLQFSKAFTDSVSFNMLKSRPIREDPLNSHTKESVISDLHGLCSSSALCPDLDALRQDFSTLLQAGLAANDRRDTTSWDTGRESGLQQWLQGADYFINSQLSFCRHRALVSTSFGCLGLAPSLSRVGDEVWILPGLRTPIVLRPCEKERMVVYTLIGETFVQRCMLGEAFADGTLEIGRTSMLVLE